MKQENGKLVTSVRLDGDILPTFEKLKRAGNWSTSEFIKEAITFYANHHQVIEKVVTVSKTELVRLSA